MRTRRPRIVTSRRSPTRSSPWRRQRSSWSGPRQVSSRPAGRILWPAWRRSRNSWPRMFRPIATSSPMTMDFWKTRAPRRVRRLSLVRPKWPGRPVESDPASRAAVAPPIVVPELRDYQQINAELVRRLNLGERHVRLEGVDGQRLLVSRMAGAWQALIEVDGNAGRGLAAGRLLIGGEAGAAVGYFQRGGLIVAVGDVGPRAGLAQCGGDLVLLGKVGALAGERQAGGRLVFKQGRTGPHAGHGRRAGRLIALPPEQLLAAGLDQDDSRLIEAALGLANRFFSPA